MTQPGTDTGADAAGRDASLSLVVLPLLKGVLYREDGASTWSGLLSLQAQVRDYVAVLGLELIIEEAEGYAFLRSRPVDDEEDMTQPRLVARRPLSFPVSLLLALLRKRLAEFDASGAETRLIITRDEAAEMMRVFLPTGSNEARVVDRVEAHLNKIVELGFARRLKPSHGGNERAYEVRRILKAFVDAEWLAEFDARLAEYRQHASGGDERPDAAASGERRGGGSAEEGGANDG